MKKIIIANWKCNPKTWKEAHGLFNAVKKTKAIICPPFVYLPFLKYRFLGAQNCHWKDSGAYTGEVSPKMLKNLGVKYVIIGHSERRNYFKETDEIINKKLKAVLKAGLKSILCVGEKRGENAEKIISIQLNKDLRGISKKDLNKTAIAYEPVWAIGTGNFCDPGKAGKTRQFIRDILNSKFQILNSRILYGGSVNSRIAGEYTKIGFDGLLVGNASLNAEEFIKIAKNV